MIRLFLVLFISGFTLSWAYREDKLTTEYEWKYFDFDWPSEEVREHFVHNGDYVGPANIPIDVDRAQDGRTFITLIRAPGVPASLNVVTNMENEAGPLLKPYPDWSWWTKGDCQGMTSVYRVAIDQCNRLWVLDTGRVVNDTICSAQLLTFDLRTDRLLKRRIIPDNIAKNADGEGLLINPVVDDYNCYDPTVIIADATGHGLITLHNEKFSRFEAAPFEPETKAAHFKIAGGEFYLADGIFSLALSPAFPPSNTRYLVFKPLASRSLYFTRVKDIVQAVSKRNFVYSASYDVLPSQGTAGAFASDGTYFFGLAGDTAIACWNINRPLARENIGLAIRDETRLQFASGLKVVKSGRGNEEILVLTNRLQKVWTGKMDFNEVNFRVLSASVDATIRGTTCEYREFSWH